MPHPPFSNLVRIIRCDGITYFPWVLTNVMFDQFEGPGYLYIDISWMVLGVNCARYPCGL